MPPEWQTVVIQVVRMKERIDFGVVIPDLDLTEQQKIAAECYQQVIRAQTPQNQCPWLQRKE